LVIHREREREREEKKEGYGREVEGRIREQSWQ
jgi:hypothetical protein